MEDEIKIPTAITPAKKSVARKSPTKKGLAGASRKSTSSTSAKKRASANSPKKSAPVKKVSPLKGSSDFTAQAKERAKAAKDMAGSYAVEAKAKTGDAVRNLGKFIVDSSSVIDDNLGAKYGDFARSAGSSVSGFGDTIEQKDFGKLTEDARDFVKKSPGVAIGIAAVAGFMLTRFLRSGSGED